MRFLIHPLREWLRKHRRLTATSTVFCFLILLTGVAVPRQTAQAGRTLICSARTNFSCDRAVAKSLFDPHCRVVRVDRIDRIVSGALRLASSL